MSFDARAAKLLQPGEHIILPEHPGLRLTCTPSRRSWVYRYKSPVDGGMRQIKLGEWPKVDYVGAVTVWRKQREEREAGKDPQLQRKGERKAARAAAAAIKAPSYTVAALVDHYLDEHIDVRRKPKGRTEVRRVLTKNMGKLAEMPAEQLQRSDVYEHLQTLADRPVLMAMVRQEMGAAYDHGLDSGRLAGNTPNWWRQVLRGKMPRTLGKTIDGTRVGTEKRVLSEKEIGLLLNFLPKLSQLMSDILTMYLWTGTRGGEIVTMQIGEITHEESGVWWTIPKHKTKNLRRENATDLRVPLIGRAKVIVLRRVARYQDDPESMGYVFPSRGRHGYVEQKTVQSSVYAHQPYAKRSDTTRAALAVLPVSRWSPHDLRRSVRTLLASMGCPSDVAESVLGHMQTGIVGVYNRHSYDAERLDWLTRLDAKLEQLADAHRLPAA
jgi:integrase